MGNNGADKVKKVMLVAIAPMAAVTCTVVIPANNMRPCGL